MLKAINTKYKGYNFRSRLEARWAVYFDQFGLEWLYESEGYDLDGTYYLPDFYFPKYKIYAEVKASEFTEEETYKCKKLAEHTGCLVIKLIGLPHVEPVDVIVPYTGNVCKKCNHSEYLDWDGVLIKCDCGEEMMSVVKIEVTDAILLLYSPKESYMPLYYASYMDDYTDDIIIRRAIETAKSARFEHGDTPF